MTTLFDPANIGGISTANRIFMAPMTRGRAESDGTPTPIMSKYYAQRAAAGLIVTEATAISAQGHGWNNAPRIYTDAHELGWKRITGAVHEAEGKIFLQLWHMGRVSHPDFQPGGALPVGPSAIAGQGQSHTPGGKKDYVTPRALDAAELSGIVNDYRAAAARAISAGFDGVEIHGANGYLLDQFIRDGSNQRSDAYGGTVENRWRFPLEVVRAIVEEVGAERTGIRLSPVLDFGGMSDSDPVATFTYGARSLAQLEIAYVHVVEARGGMMYNAGAPVVHPHIKSALRNTTLILNGGYDLASGNAVLTAGHADAIAFGVPFLANPDLVDRFQKGITQFNEPNFATFYSAGEAGYTDYPTMR